MKERKNLFKREFFIPEAFSVAILTAISYAAIFFFESSRALFFGFPLKLISMRFENLVIAFLLSLLFAAILYQYSFLSFKFARRESFKVFLLYLIFIILPSVFIFFFPNPLRWSLLFFALGCFAILYLTFMPFFIFTKLGTKFIRKSELFRHSLLTIKILPKKVLESIMIVLLFFWISFALGYGIVQYKENFLTTEIDSKDFVIAAIYPDKFVLVEFDRKNKRVLNNFFIKDEKYFSDVAFKVENIGPLRNKEKFHESWDKFFNCLEGLRRSSLLQTLALLFLNKI